MAFAMKMTSQQQQLQTDNYINHFYVISMFGGWQCNAMKNKVSSSLGFRIFVRRNLMLSTAQPL